MMMVSKAELQNVNLTPGKHVKLTFISIKNYKIFSRELINLIYSVTFCNSGAERWHRSRCA